MPTDNPTAPAGVKPDETSEFRRVFADQAWRDKFFLFLQNIFHLFPEDKFHHLIDRHCHNNDPDEVIYRKIQLELPKIKPFLQPIRYALPALRKQKQEMTEQTLRLLGGPLAYDGYLEIGTVGRYVRPLQKHVTLRGPVHLVNDFEPGNGVGDIMERGSPAKVGTFSPLDYRPLDAKGINPNSLDLVTCFIGLHHCPVELLGDFVASIHRVLRPGGVFIIRDHDVPSPQMSVFVSLVHAVFNMGLELPWETNTREYRAFRTLDCLSEYLKMHGFRDRGERLHQAGDPTENTLMVYDRV